MPLSHLCRWHRVMKFLLAHQDRPKACVVRAVAADVTQGVPRPVLCVRAQARCKWAWVAVEHLRLLIFPSLQILPTLCLQLSKKQQSGHHLMDVSRVDVAAVLKHLVIQPE
jgi:hypothetical protein